MCDWQEHRQHRDCGCAEGHPGHRGPHAAPPEQGPHPRCHHPVVDCGCGRHGPFMRHFLAREERITRLERYLEELRVAAQAVEEHVKTVRSQQDCPTQSRP